MKKVILAIIASIILLSSDECPSTSTYTYKPEPPPPTLYLPEDGDFFEDTTPYFEWSEIPEVQLYQIQVDNDSDFSSPEISASTKFTSFIPPSALDNGMYYWKVRAYAAYLWGEWSSVWSFTIM